MLKENPCEFTDEYRIGVDLIDREHEELFRIVGKASQLVKSYDETSGYDNIMELLNKLKSYTAEHFRDEEEYMESINYQGIGAQKMAHKIFVTKLEEIDLQHVDDHQQEYLEELLEFLFGWLSNHILKMDKLIGK